MEENKKRTIPFLELAIIAIFVIIIILVVKICNQLEPAPEDTSNTRPESNEVKQENEYIKALKKIILVLGIALSLCLLILIGLLIAEVMNPNLGWLRY